MKLGAERYSSKTDDYAKYRPNFPNEIVEFLYSNDFINSNSIIADIGSGTGRFTRLLLEKGNKVYGVERNDEMRAKAEQLLSQYSNFISIRGSAEETVLTDNTIDLITAAQAFHWFNKEKCLSEFKRIIKKNGKVLILWDDFLTNYNNFSIEYGKVLNKYRIVELGQMEKRFTRTEMISDFFRNNKYETLSFTHEIYQNFNSIKGGALSASFTPKPDEVNYKPFLLELQEVFEKFQSEGKVLTAFQTICYLGKIWWWFVIMDAKK